MLTRDSGTGSLFHSATNMYVPLKLLFSWDCIKVLIRDISRSGEVKFLYSTVPEEVVLMLR